MRPQHHSHRSTFFIGLWAERLASVVLWLKGYVILARRFRTPWGEIDLVVRKHHMIVFVEVKKRQTLDQALYALRPAQKMRIQKAAQYFLQNCSSSQVFNQARFDVMCWKPWAWPVHIMHAWSMKT